jgi:3-oxoacyl-[acyl-carrier-protein] synthase-3
MNVYIKAIAYNLPEKVLTNEMIAQEFPEWTVEKIDKKIGIKQRHVTEEGETASDLAVGAAEKLLAENHYDRSQIDYVIFVSQSPDYHLPTTACTIQTRLGLSHRITVIDVNLGCNGFVAGLSLAKAVIIAGQAKNVLLLTGETYSKYMHERDKSNRTIFGDGAAATLVSTDGIAEVGEFVIGTDGTGAENLIVKTGGARHPQPAGDLKFDDFGNPRSSDNLYMDGPAILNYSLDSIPQLVTDVLEKNNVTMEDIDLHVYHQANTFLANLERRKLRIPEEKYYCNIENFGNTVSSTIPIALCEAMREGKIKKGTKVLSVAQGLGYTWGGMVLFF